VIILVPRSIIGQWEEEAKRFKLHPSIDIEAFEEKYRNPAESLVFIFKIDTAKKSNYRDKILKYTWDLVVVDEVHKLGLDSQRIKLVEELVKRNPEASILFLSATPHKGDDEHYFKILSMLDQRIARIRQRGEPHSILLDALVFRRNKIQVNKVYEGKVEDNRVLEEKVFVDAEAVTQVVEIKSTEKDYIEKLDSLTREIIRQSHDKRLRRSVGLIAMLIDKRGLSSPYAGLITFRNILSSLSESAERPEYMKRYVEELLEDYRDEEYISKNEVDEVLIEAIKCSEIEIRELFRKFSKELEELGKLAEKVVSEDSKLFTLQKILREHLDRGEKVVVFTEFADTADYIFRAAGESVHELGYKVMRITGRDLVSEHEIESVKRWLAEPEPRVLISTDVASEGLNLQYANVVINYELPWSLAKLEQRTGRVWRLGQSKDVRIYLVILKHSFEEKIFNALYRKLASSVRQGIIPSTLIALKTREGLELPYSGIIDSRNLTPFKIWEVFKNRGEKGIAELVEENLERLKKYIKKIKSTGLYNKELSLSPLVLQGIKGKLKRIVGFETRREFEEFLYDIISKLGYRYDEYWIKKLFHDSVSEAIKSAMPVCIVCEGFNGREPLVAVKVCIEPTDSGEVCWFYTYDEGKLHPIKNFVSKIHSLDDCAELGVHIREEVLKRIDLGSINAVVRTYARREILSVIQASVKKYLECVVGRDDLKENSFHVDVKPLIVVVPSSVYLEVVKIIEEEIRRELHGVISLSDITEEKLEVEAKGRAILEKVLGDKYELIYVGDTKAPFDYIAKDKGIGGTMFIELKTLEKLRYVLLTENEKEFAERISSNHEYWLYVVDLSREEIEIRGYKNPLKSNKLRLFRTLEESGKIYHVYEEVGQADYLKRVSKTLLES